ncbi:hypothetical protein DMA15_12600 [Streptomyces sp. WAC 01529]|uniref:hypothetical protein n=1 Tax=Streptomyces sp. WAC 01529 TaxID=2203205 RepID=UPI000F6FC0C9|nr:hypothetical protein [Streptomyces sp. WAC 01529]AZM53322.1 hypothetical protein DMA15_12600 [Streptomyces sp. WAC 01529]
MNVAVNLGGIAIALAILWLNFRKWWKGNRDPKELVPYGAGSALGSLSTICVGGALGWGASGIAGLFSSAGSKGVQTTTGTSGAATLPTGRMGTLTPEGAVITCLVLVGVIALYKTSGKLEKRRIVGGVITFAILGFLPGVAALLAWWPDAVNWAGAKVLEVASKGGEAL